MDNKTLMEMAKSVRDLAYAPYSNYYVGAAILDEKGKAHVGCNVENAAYPQGACAEAGAIGAMISGGGKRISKIAVVGGGQELEVCTPCGGCRQRILEFSDQETEVLWLDQNGNLTIHFIRDLIPDPIQPNVDEHSGKPIV